MNPFLDVSEPVKLTVSETRGARVNVNGVMYRSTVQLAMIVRRAVTSNEANIARGQLVLLVAARPSALAGHT